MAYIDELRSFGSRNFYCLNILPNLIVMEGTYRILHYEKEKMVVLLNKKQLEFLGINFNIEKSSKNELIINGELISFKFLDVL